MNIRTIALCAALAVAAPAVHAQTKVPDAMAAGDVVTLTAKVEAVDAATRTVLVKGPMGRTIALKAGDRVKNFAQVKAGDTLVFKYAEAVAVDLRQGGAGGRSAVQTTQTAAAPAGAKPAGAVVSTTSIVANVEAVDAAKSIVVLQGPNGRYYEVKVKDVQLLKTVKANDKVDATIVEAVMVEDVGQAK